MNTAGHPSFGRDTALNFLVGTHDHEVVDASSADATPVMTNCREIYCDYDSAELGAAIAKVDYTTDSGETKTEVLTLFPGSPRNIRNVTKVYRYYAGTTQITAQSYTSAGTLVNGIKLRR